MPKPFSVLLLVVGLFWTGSSELLAQRVISNQDDPEALVDQPAVQRPVLRATPIAPVGAEPGEAMPPPETGEDTSDSAVEIPETTPGAKMEAEEEVEVDIKADVDETETVDKEEDSILKFAPTTTEAPMTTIPKKEVDLTEKSEPIRPDQIGAAILTDPDARTFTFSIPPPRGQILDRKGLPLAQSTISWYLAIDFPTFESDVDDAQIGTFVAERLKYANDLLGKEYNLTPKRVFQHYENRRWMPMVFSGALSEEEVDLLKRQSIDGLKLHPVYQRYYPNGETLSHVIGYVGQRPPVNTGPILENEPIWRVPKGVEGLEKSFENELKGVPGKVNVLYDKAGVKIKEETLSRPVPGYNIVTTLDLEMQKIAERVLRQNVKHGALVVMECQTGDIVAMASNPQYNPNDFIPYISQDKFSELMNDPSKPLFPRAFRATYPPASTFKVPIALAFMESGHITADDTRDCPARWRVGNLVMRNHTSKGEGPMNVIEALTRSCNTWFYEIAIYAGGDAMSSMAHRLGMGQRTGIPLNDAPGFIPNNRDWWDRYDHGLSDGDEAVMSIGQGQTATTPLQVASFMASVGNGVKILKPRLVSQIQDLNHEIVQSMPVESRGPLNVDSYSLSAVRKGMYNVVHAGNGTGKQGYHKITVSAKTGTGQWKPAQKQNVAWFAGYFPSNYPVYSFALIYEGAPGQNVSGGKYAAPIVKSFLNGYLNDKNYAEVRLASRKLRPDYVDSPASQYAATEPESIFRGGSTSSKKTTTSSKPKPQPKPVAKKAPPKPAPAPKRTFGKPGGLLDRLFGRRKKD